MLFCVPGFCVEQLAVQLSDAEFGAPSPPPPHLSPLCFVFYERAYDLVCNTLIHIDIYCKIFEEYSSNICLTILNIMMCSLFMIVMKS